MSTPKTPTKKKVVPAGKDAVTPAPRAATGRYQPGRNRKKDARNQATFYGRKDKSPVIFGLGRDLPAAQKTRLQRRLYYIFAGAVAVAILGVAVFGWINVNVIQPNQPIVTVYGQPIAQKYYRNMVAYLAQDTWNQIQATTIKDIGLQAQIASEKDATKLAALRTQESTLSATLSTLQTSYTQTQIDQLAIDDLVEDQLIQHNTPHYETTDPKARATLTVTSKQLNDAYTAFKNAFPKGQSLASFESQNGISDADVHGAIAVKLRRSAMDTYQQSLVTSPVRQIHFERIQFDQLHNAKADLAILQKDPSQWNALAKKDSLDVNTRDNGGDMGWAALGQQDQGIEQWMFDPSRKTGDVSGVITEISGTFDIVRIIAIDPARPLDSTTVTSLKNNALSHWLTGQRDVPPKPVSSTNQDMFNSTANIPVTPNLSVTFGSTPTP